MGRQRQVKVSRLRLSERLGTDMGMRGQNRLLIVDDEPDVRALFGDVAEEMGYVAAQAGDHAEFVAAYDYLQPTVILLDLAMPGVDGIELLRELVMRNCSAPILLASGQSPRVLATAQRLGRRLGLKMGAVLQKPIAVSDLETALEKVWIAPCAKTPETLEQAIGTGELVLHFQPKIDLRKGNVFPVIGCEALVRWMHPTRGLLPPADFVPLAEEDGLIGPLTEVVLRQTINQLCAWRQHGIELPVSINLSPVLLTDLTLPDRMACLLSDADLDPSFLVVEITEQAAMQDIDKAADILTRLRIKRIPISLDDFGAGYSSLVEIYRLPLSELKLDRSLIVEVGHDDDARTVVKALIGLAHELKLEVCAEGVETAQAAEFLQVSGCDMAQGFFFGKPLSEAEFFDFIKGGRGKLVAS